jgi:GT2 family glycosyltransferase
MAHHTEHGVVVPPTTDAPDTALAASTQPGGGLAPPAAITAVIPLFNKEREIARAVRSALNQTHPPAQVIVVDDGSTDGSVQAVQALADARVQLLRQPNAGPSGARNRGTAAAHTEFVAFLDADDEWGPTFLETVANLQTRFPQASIWATAFELVNGDSRSAAATWTNLPQDPHGGLIDDFLIACLQVPPICASGFLCRKQLLQEVGGFPEGVRLGEDFDTWIRLALRGPVAFSPAAPVLYHKDADNRAMDRERYRTTDTCLRRTLAQALQSPATPPALRQSVRILLVKHLLDVSRHALEAGDGPLARTALRDAWRQNAYRLRWLERFLRRGYHAWRLP